MTEMEFLKVFNDIEDKFVDEEIEGETEPLAPVTVNPNGAKNRFFWVKFAGIAAACAAVVGGLVYLKNNPNIVVDPSVTEGESSVQTNAPELGENFTLYQTKLNCNGNSYDVRIYLCREYTADAPSNEKYIWGDVAMELSLNGEVLDTVEFNENCYEECEWGMPFDRENLASDYFKVLSMEQDVLAYITPNSRLGEEDKSDGAVLNARFFTVSKEGKIIPINRYATEEEKKEINTNSDRFITHANFFFKITPNFDTEKNQLTYHLEKQVISPWWQNGTIYEKGDIPVSFDFENYTLTCEDDNYKYLVYCADGIGSSKDKNVTLLDGSLAKEDEITELSITVPYNPYIGDYYTTNVSFVVPFFAPWEDRTPGKEGKWTKVKTGDKIGDFEVGEVNSRYAYYQRSFFPAGYSTSIDLKGELSCTGTAERSTYTNGASDGGVIITLDKEDCEKLPGFTINQYVDYDVEDIRAEIIISNELEGFEELYHALYVQNRKSVRVELTLTDFTMTYSFETGNQNDNATMVRLKNNGYTLEIAKEDQAPRESDAINEEIYNVVNHANTYDEIKKGLSKYSDSFNRFAVYSYYDPVIPDHSTVVESGKLKYGMVCVIYYDEEEENRWEIPITKKIDEKITLMDGSIAKEEEIKELHTDPNDPENYDYFVANVAFAVPFFTPAEGRKPGEPGEWIKLKTGDKIGDFTVVSADSIYVLHFPYGYEASVELKGNLSCTGTAEKAYGIDGTLYDDSVLITLDKESCEKLFSLSFNSELYDEDFDEGRIRFFLPVSENDELYNALLVQNKESVRIKLEADSFKMRYSYETGNQLDGWSTMNLDSSDYSVEIDKGKNLTLMDGSTAAGDEILSEDGKTFTVNSCFAVPFSTVNGNRQAWEKGDWIKLKAGDTFGDYTVESAESTYTKSSEGVFPPYKSKVILSGKLSCTGTAKIIPSQTGYDGLVELTLDEDCCQKLIGLAPCLDNDFSDLPSQDRIYMWLTYKDKDYQPIIDKLQNTESVRVKLETEHFSLGYQYGSEYWYDGKVMLNSVGNEHSLEIID